MISLVIETQECRRGGIDIAAAADGSKLRVVARGNIAEKGVPPHFGDDGGGSDGDVVLLAKIERPQMRVALLQESKDFLSVGDDPLDGDAALDNLRGGNTLELIEKTVVTIAVDLFVVANLDLHIFRKAEDMLAELGAPRARFRPGPKLFRVRNAAPC